MRAIQKPSALLVLAVSLACCSSQPSYSSEPEAEIHKLPDPLNEIFVNSSDFEKYGYFTVTNLHFKKAATDKENAFVWTLRANQSMTFRHVEIFLEGFRHAHFYSRVKNVGRPAYSTLLYYSPALRIDAASGEVLPRGGSIDVWINIDPLDVAKIQGAKASSLVLGGYIKR